MVDQGVYNLASIPMSSVRRMSTGFKYLDLAYGVSIFTDRRGKPVAREAGLPCGALSLWAGEPGVGKSRLCVGVAARMNRAGHRVLYFQNEASLHEFRQWTAAQVVNPRTFLVSNFTSLQDQVKAVRKHKPNLVIIDSLNMIENSQSPAFARQVVESYKKAVAAIGGHAILVGHLNKAGSVKGNNDLQYLVDVQCEMRGVAGQLTPRQAEAFGADPAAMFYIRFCKNRFGPTSSGGCETYVAFRHAAFGVEYVTSNLANPFESEEEGE